MLTLKIAIDVTGSNRVHMKLNINFDKHTVYLIFEHINGVVAKQKYIQECSMYNNHRNEIESHISMRGSENS